MLSEIEFRNFRILRDARLPLAPFTLLVGPNGSGKSTALAALRLLEDPGALQSCDYGSLGGDPANPTVRFHETAGLTTTIEYSVQLQTVRFYENDSKTLNQLPPHLRRARYFNFDPQAMTRPVELVPDAQLSTSGGNLAGVLDQLRDEHPRAFEALTTEVAEALPEFDQIVFFTPTRGSRSFGLRTREGAHRVAASALSDGTLLVVALLALGHLPSPPPIIALEEPDRAIHPRLLRDVQDALYRLAYPADSDNARPPVQIVASTHSPTFLDLFKEHPEEVVIAERRGLTAGFHRITQIPHWEEMLADASLGAAWYSGVLGGVPEHR